MIIDARTRFPIKASRLSVREGVVTDEVRRAQLWEEAREKYRPNLEALRKQIKEKQDEQHKSIPNRNHPNNGSSPTSVRPFKEGSLIDARGRFGGKP